MLASLHHPLVDPFKAEETDPLRTDAIDSSLWELATLRKHYMANIATLAKIFQEVFTKQSYDMEDFLDHTYSTVRFLSTEFPSHHFLLLPFPPGALGLLETPSVFLTRIAADGTRSRFTWLGKKQLFETESSRKVKNAPALNSLPGKAEVPYVFLPSRTDATGSTRTEEDELRLEGKLDAVSKYWAF